MADKFQKDVIKPLDWLIPFALKLHQGASFNDIAHDLELLRPKLTRDMVLQICGKAVDQMLATQSPGIAYNLSLVLIVASKLFFDKSTEAIASMSAGGVLIQNGHSEEARSFLEFACNVFEHEGDPSLHAVALQRLGSSYIESDKPMKGLSILERCLVIVQEMGDISLEAATMNSIGTIYLAIGDNDKALLSFDEALSLARRANEERTIRDCLGNLTNVLSRLNQWTKAKSVVLEAIEIDRKWSDKIGHVKDLILLSDVENQLMEFKDAEDHLIQALNLSKDIENQKFVQICYKNLMFLYKKTDNLEQAIQCGRRAAEIAQERGQHDEEKAILMSLARLYAMS